MQGKLKRKGMAFILALSMMVPVSHAPESWAAKTHGQRAEMGAVVYGTSDEDVFVDEDYESVFASDEPDGGVPEFVPGHVPEKYDLVYPTYKRLNRSNPGEESLPSAYDTRDQYQTSVKNQGKNGVCWAFATNAAVEANMKKSGVDPDPDLSELHMAYSTSGSNGNDDQGWAVRAPDAGGNRYISSEYLMRGTTFSGTVDESEDPYVKSGEYIKDRELSKTQNKNKNYTVTAQ